MRRFLLFVLLGFAVVMADDDILDTNEYDLDDSLLEGFEGSIIFRDYYYLKPESSSSYSYHSIALKSPGVGGICYTGENLDLISYYYSKEPFAINGPVVANHYYLQCNIWNDKPYLLFDTNIPFFWSSNTSFCCLQRDSTCADFGKDIFGNYDHDCQGRGWRDVFDASKENIKVYRANSLTFVSGMYGFFYALDEQMKIMPSCNETDWQFGDECVDGVNMLPSNVTDSMMEAALDEALRDTIRVMGLSYDAVPLKSNNLSDFGYVYFEKGSIRSAREAMDVCRRMDVYYRENGSLDSFVVVSVESSSSGKTSSSVNSSSAFAPNIPVSSSESMSSSSVETSSSAVSSSSVQSSSSVSVSSSSAENHCVAHPMNSAPADPKSTCVSKSGKCYKCNASRSASECASEWLWTSPRDNFESYWYSEVDCETGALIENKGLGNCYAHPVNSAPADPKSACVSKSGKCYKCNASRSASECASEWLWTSPRDNFESYWYSEVDCETGALVENKGLGKCYAHPMNSAPADPKSACVSKSGKCYKCNASRSASECASEWLWTSPRDNFESYWYTEVDCQSAAPVLAKRGAKGDVPVITNGNMQNEDYSVDFVPRRYFDALGRSTKFTPFKHRPLFVDKPIVKKNEMPFFTNEDKFTYGSDYVNFAGVLKKEGGNGVVCRNGDICTEGSECVAGSVGNMANTILVNLKNGAEPVRVSDKWTCYDGEARRLGESFVCGVKYYDYGVIEKDGIVVGGITCTNINYSLYKPDERGVADKNNVDYMLSSKSGYFPHSEKGKAECAVYDGDGKEIHRNLTTSLELAVKTNVRIGYNEPNWVKEGFEIYTEKGEHERFVTREESEMIERHEKNGHVPLYDCLLKYGVLDTIQVVLKDVCDKDYEYDIESQYIVLHNEKDVEQLKNAVKNSKVTGRLKKRIDAYMKATVEWFHNDAYKEGCDELSSIFKEECKEPRYDHFDGPYSLIECPDVKEIEKYVPRDLIP